MAERLVRRAEAAGMLSVSVMTLDRMTKDGRVPQPIRLSPRVVGWREQTLLSLLKEREECAAQK